LAATFRQTARVLQPAWASSWVRVTSYLSLRRTRALLVCFLASSALLVACSGSDMRIASLFYDNGFYMAEQGWTRLLHQSVGWFIVASLISVAAVHVFNRLARRNVCGIDGRVLVYLLLVLILGPGLAVNVILKPRLGRARPRHVQEFGGTKHFTPAFDVTSECNGNCSFPSGDSAGAFFSLAFVFASGRKRAAAAAGIGFGVLVSAARIASGAHWFSDTVVSLFVMLIVADALHYQMFVFVPTAVVPAPSVESGVRVPS